MYYYTGMVAIIGISCEEIYDILNYNNLGGIEIANYNTSKQIVISGMKEDLMLAEKNQRNRSIF